MQQKRKNLLFAILFLTYRKISAHEFERGGLLKPIVNTIDGTPTFLSISSQNEMVSGSGSSPINLSSHPHRPQRLSRNELKHLDEKQLIFELVNCQQVKTRVQINYEHHL